MEYYGAVILKNGLKFCYDYKNDFIMKDFLRWCEDENMVRCYGMEPKYKVIKERKYIYVPYLLKGE